MTGDLAKDLVDLVGEQRALRGATILFKRPQVHIEPTLFVWRNPKGLPSRATMEERDPHYRTLRQFARDLGSAVAMETVFDEAVERFGYRSVLGVGPAWNGIYDWMH